jgi:hypothetical protein
MAGLLAAPASETARLVAALEEKKGAGDSPAAAEEAPAES